LSVFCSLFPAKPTGYSSHPKTNSHFAAVRQSELQKKDERIAVLEEALTESVSIAAEREELLAQQAQNAETAAHRVEEIEAETERVRIETAVTNTKNASLVLALNENDIILSYYKAERHRMVEQLLEMR